MELQDSQDINSALYKSASLLSVNTDSTLIKYGWGGKSGGIKVTQKNGEKAWLRVQYAKNGQYNSRNWNGEIDACAITGIRKPTLISYIDWTDKTTLWRATLMTYIAYEICSSTPELKISDKRVTEKWLNDLKTSLSKLKHVATERVCARQDLITRRIHERYGDDINTTISIWNTYHGDIHWANLTCEELFILDWEGWGKGPNGLDAAFLYAFSSGVPDVMKDIYKTFQTDLDNGDGQLSILFVCAELLRMIDLYGNHPQLADPLKKIGTDTLLKLKGY
jgi:hypothetical protein